MPLRVSCLSNLIFCSPFPLSPSSLSLSPTLNLFFYYVTFLTLSRCSRYLPSISPFLSSQTLSKSLSLYLLIHLSLSVLVVSIGRLTAFYVVFAPMEYVPSKPPHFAYVICRVRTILQLKSNLYQL